MVVARQGGLRLVGQQLMSIGDFEALLFVERADFLWPDISCR